MKMINKEKYFFFSIVILIASIMVIIVLLNFNVHRLLLFVILFIGALLSLHVYNFGKGAEIINTLFFIRNIELKSSNIFHLSFILTKDNKEYEITFFPSIDLSTIVDQIASMDITVKESIGRRYLPSHFQVRTQIKKMDKDNISKNMTDAMYNIKKSSYPFFQTRSVSKLGGELSSRVCALEKDISISDNILYITLAKASGNVYLVAFLHKYSSPEDFLKVFDFLDKLKEMINKDN